MKITLDSDCESAIINATQGASLLDYIYDNQFITDTACGGNGICTKCRVKITKGFAGINAKDKKAFTPKEIQEGWRLSCQFKPRTSISAYVPKLENLQKKPLVNQRYNKVESPFLACDLGSTSIIVALGNSSQGVFAQAQMLNKQIRYGADIMSRLHSAQKYGNKPLTDSLKATLSQCLQVLQEKFKFEYDQAAKKGLYCSGNCAMISFLNDFNTDSLAVSPFQPVSLKSHQHNWQGINIFSLPLLGGFVGADAWSGIITLENKKVAKPWMLVDIGTNTEVILAKDNGQYLFSSAPAGPAFEGGNIAKGMRADPGAIEEAKYENGSWKTKTVANDIAKGICGSGLIQAIDEMLKNNLLKTDGYLVDKKVNFTEKIYLTIDDIREFQLAKAATRSACDLMIKREKISPNKIYLAGNFANHLNLQSVRNLGILPKNIEYETIGNGVLDGIFYYAQMSLKEKKDMEQRIRKQAKHIELASQNDFQEQFIKNLNFK